MKQLRLVTRVLIFILSLFLFVGALFSQQNVGSNAGVLAYCKKDGELFILLSKAQGDNDYWNDNTGNYEEIDDGQISKTAFREFMQETRFAWTEDSIKKQINGQPPIQTTFDNYPDSYRYLVDVAFIKEGDLADLPYKNKKPYGIEYSDTNWQDYDSEKDKYCWVALSDILDSVDNSTTEFNAKVPEKCSRDYDERGLHKHMRNALMKQKPTRIALENI